MTFDFAFQGNLFLIARSNLAQADSMRSVAFTAGSVLDYATQSAYLDAALSALTQAKKLATDEGNKMTYDLGSFQCDGTQHNFNFGVPTNGVPMAIGSFQAPDNIKGKTMQVAVFELPGVRAGWKKVYLSRTPGDVSGPVVQGTNATVRLYGVDSVTPGETWYFTILHEMPFSHAPSVTPPNPVGFAVRVYPAN